MRNNRASKMKRNSNFLYNAEALMLLAEFLHNALLWRGHGPTIALAHEKPQNIDKHFEKAMERLRKSIDYRARSADRLLRYKITSMSLPRASKAVCINISASPKKSKKKKV